MSKSIESDKTKNWYDYLTDWNISYYTTAAIRFSINHTRDIESFPWFFDPYSFSYYYSKPFDFFMEFLTQNFKIDFNYLTFTEVKFLTTLSRKHDNFACMKRIIEEYMEYTKIELYTKYKNNNLLPIDIINTSYHIDDLIFSYIKHEQSNQMIEEFITEVHH